MAGKREEATGNLCFCRVEQEQIQFPVASAGKNALVDYAETAGLDFIFNFIGQAKKAHCHAILQKAAGLGIELLQVI
ncbi:MAG TPA: hypothetical protein VF480_08680, partial [Verrucomicrobiae bacterium]